MGLGDWVNSQIDQLNGGTAAPVQPQPETANVTPADAPALTAEDLAAAGVTQPLVNVYLTALNAACAEFQIVSPVRSAMFLAQVAVESGSFRWVQEIWGPTQAQAAYEGRADLGNTQPGDGSLFRGHGLIQITGRYEHQKVADYFGLSSAQSAVQWLVSPEGACRAAGWFWQTHGCNELADAGNFTETTRRINGGLTAEDRREAIYGAIRASRS